MCPDCQSEYDDPTNRRFHAQPNACPKCGPQIKLFDSKQNNLILMKLLRLLDELLKKEKLSQ